MRQYDEAIADLNQLVELPIVSPAVFFNLGNAYMGLKEFEHAKSAYRKVISLVPHDIAARFNLGLALIESNQLKIAVECMEGGLVIDPDNGRIQELLRHTKSRLSVDVDLVSVE